MPQVVSDYTAILATKNRDEYRWNGTEKPGFPVIVTYSFHTDATAPDPDELYYEADESFGFTKAQKDAFRDALAKYEAVTGILFVETTGEAMIEAFAVTGSPRSGWAHYPMSSVYYTSSGDLIIDVTTVTSFEGYTFDLLLHEIGHAVGLAHPHSGDPLLSDAKDSTVNTVMSYNWVETPQGKLGPLDIQALKHLYGPAVDTTGWTTGFKGQVFKLKAGPEDDRIMGVLGRNDLNGRKGDDIIVGREDRDILRGGPGDDELRGMNGRDVLKGGGGDDTLIAGGKGFSDWNTNILNGGRGNDTLIGDVGLDKMIGGKGSDTFVFRKGDAGSTDVIRDFEPGIDVIDIRGMKFADRHVSLQSADGGEDTILTISKGSTELTIRFDGVARDVLEPYVDVGLFA